MSFPLVGNGTIKSAVENAIAAHRIPHAILIEGDAGLGRHTLARYIAKAAVCEGEERPCGSCRHCHLSDVGSHPAISVIAPEEGKKQISVDQIRALRAEAFVKAHSAECRVFIIDGAERMNENAQNALLKVLEEPPVGVKFILITLSRTILLSTIVSRCTVLSLSAPERTLAEQYLKDTTDYDLSKISEAVKQTGGNVGAAMVLLYGREDSIAASAAKSFIKLLFEGSAYQMLTALHPLEKNRIATDEFFSELSLLIVAELHRSANNSVRCRVLDSLYENIRKYKELLITNINLPLLFCAFVCSSKELVER